MWQNVRTGGGHSSTSSNNSKVVQHLQSNDIIEWDICGETVNFWDKAGFEHFCTDSH